ncbi:hypothetical protein EV667_3273 [Ancylobacter aquaticus]|uniref:DUF1109 domain-containing protein n=1 Tax=Ancylobacter aquaticus TaxID=100 RepID=A0A4R1HLW2_ANCAQ|nr:DUF1109 domain-containing protein [Ancylobacter aquaticus]TCK23447.1 hypothetical protein EV667_3273 [Ancylobacter aquaticus]
MKTAELIELLARDVAHGRPFRTVFLAAAFGSVAFAGALFFSSIGVRPDLDHAARTVRFLAKFAITVPLAIGATGWVMAMACPGSEPGAWRWVLAAAPIVLLGAIWCELWLLPPEAWQASMTGHNARFCLTLIPLLSILPLACLLAALRHGAPTQPGRAGAIAGLAAASIAATFYAANCDDDSPLFVLLWYPIAMSVVVAAGYVVGQRLLRW